MMVADVERRCQYPTLVFALFLCLHNSLLWQVITVFARDTLKNRIAASSSLSTASCVLFFWEVISITQITTSPISKRSVWPGMQTDSI